MYKYAQLSYNHFNKINKQPHKKYAYYSLAIAYNNNGNFKESETIYKELINYATENQDTTFLFEVLESYSHLLWYHQKHSHAKIILKSLELNHSQQLSAKSLAHLAEIYSNDGKQDSSIYYLSSAKKTSKYYNDSIAISIAEYNISLNSNDYISTIEHLQSQIKQLNTSTENVWKQSVMTLQRDYFESQAKNANLEVESKKNQIILIVIISVAILFIAIFIIYALRMKNKAQKEKINRILNEHYQSQNLISNAEKRISELEALLENETDKSQRLINELAIQKESLQLFTQQEKLREEATNAIETSDVATRFRKALDENANPTKDDWEQLDNYINLQFPGFKSVLYKLVKLSEIEYQVSLLIKCKFFPNEIGRLVNLSKSGLGNSRKRLFVKAFKTDGTASDWDKFIISL